MAINFNGGTGGEGAGARGASNACACGKEESRVIAGLIDKVIESSRFERVRLPL